MSGRSAADELAGAIEAARASWPGISVPIEAFVAYLDDVRARRPAGASGALAVGDLYLAYGCLRGDPGALDAFEREHVAHVRSFVAHLVREPDRVSEVEQRLRAHLLVQTSDRPAKIAQYAGAGPLAGWVRVAAIRTALDLLREADPGRHAPPDDHDEPLLAPDADPELEFFRTHYRAEFKAALDAALATLDVEELSILRLHHGEKMTVDALAALFRVGRSTMVRRLARARERIAEQTRLELTTRLGLRPTEVDSILGLVMSHLDMTLSRMLAKPAAGRSAGG